MIFFISLFLFFTGLSVFLTSIAFAKKGKFYSDTFWLLPLGIFVWGDGLILGPFWMGIAIIINFFPIVDTFRLVILFFIVRSFIEVIYWITHQVSSKEYNPPLFRNLKWIQANEAAILYQLINMVQVIIGLFLLIKTF